MGMGVLGGGVLGGASIGLADKHFRPIELEAKKIKESQKSNLGDKLKNLEFQAQQQQLTQSQLAQAKFYKNLTNKKTGPLAASLKKGDTAGAGTTTAAAIQALTQAATKDPSGGSINVDMIPPHECKVSFLTNPLYSAGD